MLVIDDAYFEYVNEKKYSSGLKLFLNSKNVVITRTFSKIYGLAGLRVGWGYSSKRIIDVLNQLKPPFNVSRPALFAASAAITDKTWLKKEVNHVNKWSKKMFEIFKKLKIETNMMQVLEALLRLRQAACHIGMLPGKRFSAASF